MKNLTYIFIGLLIISCGGGSDDEGTNLDTNCRFVGLKRVCPTGDFSTLVWQEEFDGASVNTTPAVV